jgi:hypothetical protein
MVNVTVTFRCSWSAIAIASRWWHCLATIYCTIYSWEKRHLENASKQGLNECNWDIVDKVEKVRTRTWQLILDSLRVIPTPTNDDLVILPAPAPQTIKHDASPSSATGCSPMYS